MAPLKVHKPAAVIFDLVATATKSFFIDQILLPYIKKNAKQYLIDNWKNEVLQHDVSLLRNASKKDESAPKVAEESSGDAKTVQESVLKYVFHCLDNKKDNEGMTLFRFHVIFDGYEKNRLETPLYTDVAVQMHHWVVEDNVKLYLFSNGWKEATKRYLEKTSKGDMNLLISDHFDTEEGQLSDPATFKKIIGKIKQPADDVLFLTHCGKEGLAAKKAGVGAILIMTHRRDVDKLSAEEKKALPYVRSFNEIVFTGSGAPKAHQLDGSSVLEEEMHEKSMEEKVKSKKTPSSGRLEKRKSSSKLKKSSSCGSLAKSSSHKSISHLPSSSSHSKSATIEVEVVKVVSGSKVGSSHKSASNAVPSKSASKLSNKSKKSVDGGSSKSALAHSKSHDGSKGAVSNSHGGSHASVVIPSSVSKTSVSKHSSNAGGSGISKAAASKTHLGSHSSGILAGSMISSGGSQHPSKVGSKTSHDEASKISATGSKSSPDGSKVAHTSKP